MTFTAAGPVASGCPYVVTDVAGRSPAGLDDFVGDIAFTVRKGDQSCQVSGTGGRTGPGCPVQSEGRQHRQGSAGLADHCDDH